jgi:hypothetical protein
MLQRRDNFAPHRLQERNVWSTGTHCMCRQTVQRTFLASDADPLWLMVANYDFCLKITADSSPEDLFCDARRCRSSQFSWLRGQLPRMRGQSGCGATEEKGPIMLTMYLTGCIGTTLGVLVACVRLPGMRDGRLLSAVLLAAAAGVLWPVLVIGVLQLVGIVLLVDTTRRRHSRRSEEPPPVAVARLEPVT